MVKSKHTHPNPTLDRVVQYGAAAVATTMVISVPLQILLTLLGAPGGLFILSALVTLGLAPSVLMLTTASPAITLDDAGLTLSPVIWREREVPWGAVSTVKRYPLLPPASGETQRRLIRGRKNYTAAEGLMLVIPSLPVQYRITGFFAGEGGRPVIAVTNRTHTEYTKLAKKIRHYARDVVIEDDDED